MQVPRCLVDQPTSTCGRRGAARNMTSIWPLSLLAFVLLIVVHAEDLSATEWLKRANAALTSYDYAGALEAFDHAIELDPDSYLTYFRRATAQQALGRTGAALKDLASTIERNPSFGKAYLQQARIGLWEGEYAQAHDALKRMKKGVAKNAAERDSEQAKELLDDVKRAESLQKQLDKAHAKSKDECVALADKLLKLAPNSISARKQRAECNMELGHIDMAVTDWTRLAKMSSSPELQLRLSLLSYYILGTRDSQMQDAGLAHLKACLHDDPENKQCIRAHKQLRKIDKTLKKARGFVDDSKWTALISALKGAKVGGPTVYEEIEKVLEDAKASGVLPPTITHPARHSELLHEIELMYCKAFVEQNLVRKAAPWCDKIEAIDPGNAYVLVAKGERLMSEEKYEEAVRVLTQAYEHSDHDDHSIRQRLSKAQKLLKQSKSKDYYKVLGVSRDADERTIKKAYRRLAREHHPDKGGDQEKMTQINEAFGVLGNPELRERYDQGDDPNDPSGGQHADYGDMFAHASHPFAQFFQQAHFQYGGGQHEFHFEF